MLAPLTRQKPRMVAGVCSGLAAHLGWNVLLIRVVMTAACFFFGAGILLYVWLWWFVPVTGKDAPGNPIPVLLNAFRSPGSRSVAIGAAVLLVAGILVIGILGLAVQWQILLPAVGIIAGMVLLWFQLDSSRRALLWRRTSGGSWGLLRLVLGVLLVVVGAVVLVLGTGGWQLVVPAVLAVLAVLLGIGLVVAPWLSRLWQDLQAERAARVRETERAEIGAHLHDSVLQTLALIQRRSDSSEIKALARSQERALRDWIYGDSGRDSGHLVAVLKQSAAQIEHSHQVQVDVVAVGDAQLSPAVLATAHAAREAMLNAARHGQTDVSVYVEARPERVEVFVKDRGAGFDVEALPHGRLGVKESVIGRMARNGGSAKISSSSSGTEVVLSMPLTAKEDS